MEEWKFDFVMNNISVATPVEHAYIAIVPYNDPRVIDLLKKYESLHLLINKFTDQFGRRSNPSVILVKQEAPERVNSIASIVGFRNIFAICSVVSSWENFLYRGQNFGEPTFAEYFNIYPIFPQSDYKYLSTKSPALTGLADDATKFVGQTTPGLPIMNYNPDYDKSIYGALLNIWENRFVRNIDDRLGRTIFRSLKVAYQACSMPFENVVSIYDYGTRIALWISAFEILAHPGGSEEVKIRHVFELLDRVNFCSRKLNYRRYIINKKKNKHGLITKKEYGQLSKKLFKEMKEIRNSFLHGDKVAAKNFFPKQSKDVSYLQVAPLLYKVALMAKLGIPQPNIDIEGAYGKNRHASMLEEGLMKVLYNSKKGPIRKKGPSGGRASRL